jgi:hypothetical protein
MMTEEGCLDNYADDRSSNRYPQNISVGDYLLPLLYIYYFGNPSNEKRALPIAHYQKYLSLLYDNDLRTMYSQEYS